MNNFIFSFISRLFFIETDMVPKNARGGESLLQSRKKIKALEKEILNFQRQCGLELQYEDINGKVHELGTIDEEKQCDFKRLS